MKKAVVTTLFLGIAMVSFSAPAEAGSSFSISFSDHNWSGHYHGRHLDRWERKALRRHKRAMRRHLRHHHRHHWRAHYGSYYHPYVAPHTSTVIYRDVIVEPQPILHSPAPLLANQASPSYSRGGQTCREYQSQATIGGRAQNTYGTACLQPDGVWRVVD